jgi:hypothetical protein
MNATIAMSVFTAVWGMGLFLLGCWLGTKRP